MAKTPWEMAADGAEFSHQTALFSWAAMARLAGVTAANDPLCYSKPGYLIATYKPDRKLIPVEGASVGVAHWPEGIEELKWLHAIKNQGHGDRVRGSRSRAEGVREGVFDVFLPVSAYHQEGWRDKWPLEGGLEFETQTASLYKVYCGLYLELKTPDRIGHKNGGASDTQLEFQAFARSQGYAAEVVHGWEAARDCLLTYLGKSVAS